MLENKNLVTEKNPDMNDFYWKALFKSECKDNVF
jgi:hypothetical protein